MRPFQRLEIEWSDSAKLDIEVEGVRAGGAAVAPDISGATVLAFAPQAIEPAPPAMCWRDDEDRLFEPLQLREQTDYLVDVFLPIGSDLARSKAAASPVWPFADRLAKFFHRDPEKRWQFQKGSVRITGRLNFRSHAGLADLQINGGRSLLVEVVPRKISYLDDFRTLLTEVSSQLADLLLQVDAGTAARFGLGQFEKVDPRALLFHLRRLMSPNELPEAIDHLMRSGSRRLQSELEYVGADDLEAVDAEQISLAVGDLEWTYGGRLNRLFRGYTPIQLPRSRKHETSDTPENRYVKTFLEELLVEMNALYGRLMLDRLDRALREVRGWADQIGEWLSHPMWSEVGALTAVPTNSQLLQRGTGYREVLAAELALQYGMNLPWDRGSTLVEGLEGEIRPVDELYQYWCFFALRDALRAICGEEGRQSGTLLKRSKGELRVNLKYGEKSRIDFSYSGGSRNAARVYLYYNKTFRRRNSRHWYLSGSYSADFRPDYSLLVLPGMSGGARGGHWVHFDAKYRLDAAKWLEETRHDVYATQDEASSGRALRGRYKRENLDEMHAYRDAVLGSRGAYVLFPGSQIGEDVFVRLPQRIGPGLRPKVPGVGALPLKPSPMGAQRRSLEAFIRSLIDAVVGSNDYSEEEGVASAFAPRLSGE